MNVKYIDMTAHPGGLTKLTIVVDGDRTNIGTIVGKVQGAPDKYEVDLRRIRSKRGLTANAYYWALADKLSKALGTSKDEVHEEMMHRYGTIAMNDKGNPVVFSIQAGEDPKSVTQYSRSFAEGVVNGKRFIHYVKLKGSSSMTAEEFGMLLDGLISECKEVGGIETMTPAEVAQLEYIDSNHANN